MIIDVAMRSLICLKFYKLLQIFFIYTSYQKYHISYNDLMPLYANLGTPTPVSYYTWSSCWCCEKQILTLLIYYYRLSVLMEKLKRQKLPMAAPMALTRQKMEPLRKMRKKETKKRETKKKI